jgi:hypothetical protein
MTRGAAFRQAVKVGALITALLAAGCGRPATSADCAAIFERIFALEFRESGFRDPVLQARKHDELVRRLAPYLDECTSARLGRSALDCVSGAQSTEEISHRCLR